MRLTTKQIQRLANMIIDDLKAQNNITFKSPEEKVRQRAAELVKADFEKEAALDIEVNRMMDELERKNPGEFQRYKMFPLLKKKLAKDKGIVL